MLGWKTKGFLPACQPQFLEEGSKVVLKSVRSDLLEAHDVRTIRFQLIEDESAAERPFTEPIMRITMLV